MFLIGEEQKKLQDNLKNISDEKIYQELVKKATKCFKKNVWTMMLALLFGIVLSIGAIYLLCKRYPTSAHKFWILNILYFCCILYLIVMFVSFAQFIGFVICNRRISDDELSYLNGVLLENAIYKELDKNTIRTNKNGVFFLDSDAKLIKIYEGCSDHIKVVIKEYPQLNDLCVVTSVKECLIYEDNIFINSYLIERKTPGLIMKVMDEL